MRKRIEGVAERLLVFFARPISLFVQSGFCSAPDREFYAL